MKKIILGAVALATLSTASFALTESEVKDNINFYKSELRSYFNSNETYIDYDMHPTLSKEVFGALGKDSYCLHSYTDDNRVFRFDSSVDSSIVEGSCFETVESL